MAKIDLTVIKDRQERAIKRMRERNIILPTFAQMKNPDLIRLKLKKNYVRSAFGMFIREIYSASVGRTNQ